MKAKPILTTLLLILSLTPVFGFNIAHVQIKNLSDTSFKRISEYFTGKESSAQGPFLEHMMINKQVFTLSSS